MRKLDERVVVRPGSESETASQDGVLVREGLVNEGGVRGRLLVERVSEAAGRVETWTEMETVMGVGLWTVEEGAGFWVKTTFT